MARADKVEVVLSSADRQLLRDIRDALRALNPSAGDEARKDNTVRLMDRKSIAPPIASPGMEQVGCRRSKLE